jgi:(p)ppGpp synthase/HD superfamily hydrolase
MSNFYKLPWTQLIAIDNEEDIRSLARERLPLTLLENTSEALELCIEAHRGQFRDKGDLTSNTPYALHPVAVAIGVYEILVQGTNSPPLSAFEQKSLSYLVISALLHDVIEDCDPEWAEIILDKFGFECFETIYHCTKPSGKWYIRLNRKDRKEIERIRICSVGIKVKLIKLVDRIHNLFSWPETDSFAWGKDAVYLRESRNLLDAIVVRGGLENAFISSLANLLSDRINYMASKEVSPV